MAGRARGACPPATRPLPARHPPAQAAIWLEDYLQKWKGTLLIVSHDQDFLSAVVTDIIHLSECKLWYYKGDYDDYKAMHAQKVEKQWKDWEKQQKALKAAKLGGASAKDAKDKALSRAKSRRGRRGGRERRRPEESGRAVRG